MGINMNLIKITFKKKKKNFPVKVGTEAKSLKSRDLHPHP